MTLSGRTDAELVGDTLAGNRNAFAEIVGRFQGLVCSLAYSATGDFARSEDLAQDTFLAAWRQLSELREPGKLRAWVCGIARNRIQDSIRKQYREPTHKAEALEKMDTAQAPEDLPSEQAVSKDEAAIVWRALEKVPETYREPLILFHRENQSVAQVAALLELTEDAVKQRLARGRKLLEAEVEATVEGALRRTMPTQVFTSNVMAALPAAGAVAAKVTTGTAMAAKGLMDGGIAGFFKAILASPAMAFGFILFERKRMLVVEGAAASLEERELLATHRRIVLRLSVAATVILVILSSWTKRQNHLAWYAPIVPVAIVGPLLIAVFARVTLTRSSLRRIWAQRGESPPQRSWEYRSQQRLSGLPLVHIRLGFNPRWSAAAEPVKAWIAIGHIAYGAFFACGSVAIAPVSLGYFALGLVSVGFCAFGGTAFGLFVAALFAVGGVALGWMASGGLAFGAHSAYGIHAYARNFAGSPAEFKNAIAYALHANDAVARNFFAQNVFFSWTSNLYHDHRLQASVLFLTCLLLWCIWAVVKLGHWPRAASR